MKEKSTIHFDNLDGLRFVCFLLVFLRHSFHTENVEILKSPIYNFVKFSLFGNGNLGVNFFFVLSGYLITYLLIQEKESIGKINIKYFWIRRILRIWPLYFVCVLFGFFIFPLLKSYFGQVPAESAHLFSYLTFTNNFDVIQNGTPDASILATLWTIAIEEQFYFVWPLLLSLIPVKKYWIVFSVVIVGSLIFRATHDNHYLYKLHTLSCMGDLAIGALGAWMISRFPNFKNLIENLNPNYLIMLYVLTLVCYFSHDEIFLSTFPMRVIERFVLALLFIAIILEQCFSKNSLCKMAKNKLFTRLGKISYGLYCLHSIAILITLTITSLWQTSITGVLFIDTILSLFLSIVISSISYLYLEKPFLKLKEKFQVIFT